MEDKRSKCCGAEVYLSSGKGEFGIYYRYEVCSRCGKSYEAEPETKTCSIRKDKGVYSPSGRGSDGFEPCPACHEPAPAEEKLPLVKIDPHHFENANDVELGEVRQRDADQLKYDALQARLDKAEAAMPTKEESGYILAYLPDPLYATNKPKINQSIVAKFKAIVSQTKDGEEAK